MKRLIVITVAALAIPAVAQAKELTGLALCGQSGCKPTKLEGFGPFDPAGGRQQAPPPGPFYRIQFEIDGRHYAWFAYYEPRSGLAAFEEGMAAGMTWSRLDPAVAESVKEMARELEPFPSPPVPEVRIGSRTVSDRPATWLRLFAVEGASVVPQGGAEVIRFISPAASPWTASSLLYYPANDVLQTGLGRFVKLPAEMAADVEAARPLVDDGRNLLPWLVLAALIVGLLLFAGLGTLLPRPSLKRAVVTGTVLMLLALVLVPSAAAKFRITLKLEDATPRVGQPVGVVLRTAIDPGEDAVMRLIAVPPRTGIYEAIRREERFGIPLARRGARSWEGTIRFGRPGRWLLVVPNWGAPGYAIPPPVIRSVVVGR